jgi:hypothetical protein
VRAHNLWARDWTVLITLSGWFFLVLGLFRMFAAGLYQRGSAITSTTAFMILEGILLIVGLIMTYKAYSGGEELCVSCKSAHGAAYDGLADNGPPLPGGRSKVQACCILVILLC